MKSVYYIGKNSFVLSVFSLFCAALMYASELSSSVAPKDSEPPDIFETAWRKVKFSLEPHERTFVEAEFVAPFYTDLKEATLRFVYPEKEKSEIVKVCVEIFCDAELSDKIKSFELVSNRGVNDFKLDISDLLSGRFPVKISWNDKYLVRLLRIERESLPVAVQPEGANIGNSRIVLVDDYHVWKRDKLFDKVCRPKTYEIAKAKFMPSRKVFCRHNIVLSADRKNLVARWQDWDEASKSYKWKHALANIKSPDKWVSYDYEYKGKVLNPSPFEKNPQKINAKDTKGELSGRYTFKIYDAARDGKPPVRDIFVIRTRYEKSPITLENGEKLKVSSTYPVWEKKKGELIVLTPNPICDDNELDTLLYGWEGENRTNDNYGGTYVSDDGKKVFYIVSRLPFRRKPMTIEYDNIRSNDRIQTVYWSQDGFKWNKQCIFPRVESDRWYMQEYGMVVQRDPRSNLNWGVVLRFNVKEQRLYFVLATSRDYANWRYVENEALFIDDNKIESWLWGFPWMPKDMEFRDGDISIRMIEGFPMLHNMFTVFNPREKYSEESVRRIYKGKDLEKMPCFDEIGGYAGYGDFMRNRLRRTFGVMVMRSLAYAALEAKAEEGTVETRTMRGSGSLFVDAETGTDGYVKVDFLDKDGVPLKEISAVTFTGKSSAFKMFDKLPDGVFRIRVKMKNAKLFSFDVRSKK